LMFALGTSAEGHAQKPVYAEELHLPCYHEPNQERSDS